MGPAVNPPRSGTSVRSSAPRSMSDRARAFLLSFSVPGERNLPEDLARRAIAAVHLAQAELETGAGKTP